MWQRLLHTKLYLKVLKICGIHDYQPWLKIIQNQKGPWKTCHIMSHLLIGTIDSEAKIMLIRHRCMMSSCVCSISYSPLRAPLAKPLLSGNLEGNTWLPRSLPQLSAALLMQRISGRIEDTPTKI